MRVSFAGGGTDFADEYATAPGCVVSAAINWRVYVLVHPLDELSPEQIRCSYAQVESVQRRDEIHHPIIRAALELTEWHERIGIYTWSDVPARNGLGGSSAFAVALLQALYASRQVDRSRGDLAMDAIRVERQLAQERGGVQDHFAAAFGGIRAYSFSSTYVGPVAEFGKSVQDALSESLCLIPLGTRPQLPVVSSRPERRRLDNQRRTAFALSDKLNGWPTLAADDVLSEIGKAMSASQAEKVSIYASEPRVDEVISLCQKSGSLGEKLAGAGGGGFVAAIIPPRRRQAFDGLMKSKGLRTAFPGVSAAGILSRTFDPSAA